MIFSLLNLELTDFVKPSFYVMVFKLHSVLILHIIALEKGRDVPMFTGEIVI